MAILSNINGKFAVDSTGAIQLSGSAGTANYVLVSGGAAAAPTWVAASTVIGGPYLPLSGGTLTGATATATGISFTVGGNIILTPGNSNKIILTPDTTSHYITANSYWIDVIGNQYEVFRVYGGVGGTTEFMRIDGAGRTIIQAGTFTTPGYTPAQGYPLHVQGIANQCFISIGRSGQTTGSQGMVIGLDTTTSYVWNREAIDISFGTDPGGELMRIDSGGNVGIGQTSPGAKLEIGKAQSDTMTYATAFLALRGNPGGDGILMGQRASTPYAGWIQAGYTNNIGTSHHYPLALQPHGANVGIGTTSPFSKLQVGTNTFSGGNGMHSDGRVGISNHGSLTGLMLASTYNDATYPEYGLVFVQGPTTSSYNVWSISPDGPAKGSSLIFNYQAQSTNIHSPSNAKVCFQGSTGNVGIGTTSPASKLHIDAASGTADLFAVGDVAIPTSGAEYGVAMIKTASTEFALNITSYSLTGKGVRIYNNGADAARTSFEVLQGAGSRFIVDGIGNVGIGTTNPGAKLDVKNDDGVGNGLHIVADFNRSAGTDAQLILGYYANGSSVTGPVVYAANSKPLLFAAGGAEKMRIENTGYTKITDDGDTTWNGYSFHAITQSAASQPTVMIYNDNAGGNNYGINVIHRSTSANTTGRFFLGATNNGGTENIKIYTNGNIQNTNNSYTQLSDSRLKENIVDATSKLEEIKRLRVVNWNFIGDDLKQIGMVAQEVEEIFPGLVDVTGDNQIIHGTTYENVKSLKYSVLVPILVKAIQELEARVTELENK